MGQYISTMGVSNCLSLLRSLSSKTRPGISSLITRQFHPSLATNMPINVGDKIPSVVLFEDSPANKVDIAELTAGKKTVIFGVPGAFTPGCSKTHLPGYVAAAAELQGKGVHEIVCVSVNDPFVMEAWGKDQGAEGKVRMLADTCGDLAKALELELDLAAVLGSVRCKRFSMLVEDGPVSKLNVEPDGTGLTCSLADKIV